MITWVAIGVGYAAVLVAVGYFASRLILRLAAKRHGSPPCDRCDKPTEKPWLWNTPRRRWHCSPCENEITGILLDHPSLAKDYREDLY